MLRDRAREKSYDAVVVGSGPNGLSAALTLLRQGLRVLVAEGHARPGGGTRTEELTLPGFLHDVCSAIHPLALASPVFRPLKLDALLVQPAAPLAHPLPDGSVAMLEQDLAAMPASWRALFEPFARSADALFEGTLGPLKAPARPLLMSRFGLFALRSATGLARARFADEGLRALFAGCAAHSVVPLERPATAAFGLMLALSGHAVGWPLVRGGSERLAERLVEEVLRLGGELICGERVQALGELPEARAVLFDTSARALAEICGDALPRGYSEKLRAFRQGPGVFKIDYALDAPIPWHNEEALRAATVHVGGTLDELAASERACWTEMPSERPFVLVAQQSLFDPSRAPPGKHTAWAYCHVPNGFRGDRTLALEAQLERFAPGFRERVLARSVRGPATIEQDNPNNVGGDIGGGANDLAQLFARPVARLSPYCTPNRKLYLCSSATPPGGGVHGMCGFHAARAALRRVFGISAAAAA